jgi:hypothetical protein
LVKRWIGAAPVVALGLIFGVLAYWGGAPHRDAAFFAGVVVLLAALGLYGGLVWVLLFKPLAPEVNPVPQTSVRARQILAMLVGICGVNFVVGGIWDAVWHLTYGIPFGKDLLWRPHLLLYSSFLLIAGFAFGGLYIVFKQGQGSLQQRYRQNPLIGLLALVSGFMLMVVPADPIWHTIYGEDISAWSLPHLVLAAGFTLVMIVSAMVQASTSWRAGWQTIRDLQFGDVFTLLPLAFACFITLLLGTVEWSWIDRIPAHPTGVFWQRPEWLYPVICLTLAVLFSVLALRLTRLSGAAALVGLAVLGIQALTQAAAGPLLPVSDGWLALLAALGVEIAYGWSLRRFDQPGHLSGQPPPWYWTGTASTLLVTVIGLPLISRTMIYPRVNLAITAGTLIAGLVMAGGAAWLAETPVSRMTYMFNHMADAEAAPSLPRLLPVGLAAVLAAFIALFIATAVPPV